MPSGRPQFDDEGVAVIFVHDVKKDFYKKFMHEPFPVESSLHTQLANHLNAEIVAGTIGTKQVSKGVTKPGGDLRILIYRSFLYRPRLTI